MIIRSQMASHGSAVYDTCGGIDARSWQLCARLDLSGVQEPGDISQRVLPSSELAGAAEFTSRRSSAATDGFNFASFMNPSAPVLIPGKFNGRVPPAGTVKN